MGIEALPDSLILAGEVRDALGKGLPVVALESTLIAHGMPAPDNLGTALALERIIREEGCVPATIAVLGGKIRVGLTGEELEFLASSKEIQKAGRRDLPLLLARGLHAATTVSATMAIASLAGIRVFVTGGIGGVHRGAGKTFDVSADLLELARTPVAVVCAGAKSVLDLKLTLEVLETLSVPILGYGTDEFPSFYSRRSDLPLDMRVDTPDEAARVMKARWELGREGGILIVNPIPEEAEIPREEIEPFIGQALKEAGREGIRGKALTPFLLKTLGTLTQGRSLSANIALVKHNAQVGGAVAAAFHRLK